MRLEDSFRVDASAGAAWDLLMDVPRVVPCMPGAELVETVDDSHWKARVRVRLGPVSLVFDTDVERAEVDEPARRVRLKASAREARGRGRATATIESSLHDVDSGGTRVDIVTDLTLVGTVAQYGRGVIHDVSGQLVSDFAGCLQAQLTPAVDAAPGARPAAAPRSVSGLRLVLVALRGLLRRRFQRTAPDTRSSIGTKSKS